MAKISPYLRPIIIIVFGLIIWIRKIDTFIDSWLIASMCLVYGLLRAYFVYRKQSDDRF